MYDQNKYNFPEALKLPASSITLITNHRLEIES